MERDNAYQYQTIKQFDVFIYCGNFHPSMMLSTHLAKYMNHKFHEKPFPMPNVLACPPVLSHSFPVPFPSLSNSDVDISVVK